MLNSTYELGYVFYKTNIWNDNEAFRGGMIFLIVLVMVLIGVGVLLLVRKYHNSRAVRTAKDHPSAQYINTSG